MSNSVLRPYAHYEIDCTNSFCLDYRLTPESCHFELISEPLLGGDDPITELVFYRAGGKIKGKSSSLHICCVLLMS